LKVKGQKTYLTQSKMDMMFLMLTVFC